VGPHHGVSFIRSASSCTVAASAAFCSALGPICEPVVIMMSAPMSAATVAKAALDARRIGMAAPCMRFRLGKRMHPALTRTLFVFWGLNLGAMTASSMGDDETALQARAQEVDRGP